MRILMVAERLTPHIGGVETHVAGLTRVLVARGHQVTLAAPRRDPHLPDEEERDSARVFWLPHTGDRRGDYLRAWRWWMGHWRLLSEADAIHFHGIYPLLHWFGPGHLLCPKMRRYLTCHGYEMRYPIPPRARFYRWLGTRLVRGSMCVGHFLVPWFGLRPQFVTYGATRSPEEIPAPPEMPRAVFVGRLAPDTGIDIYVRGLGLLQRQHALALPLIVCGDGPLRPAIETLAQEEGVEAAFLGFVSNPQANLAQGTMAFVSGFLAILEAAALRRPVFSVYHNPVKESYLRGIPGAEEMLHIASSPTELSGQLADHLCHPAQAAAMVDRAAAFAATWTWDRLADDYLRLWNR
jgi:glycosyltransferase involved in cell wall biosynthesis